MAFLRYAVTPMHLACLQKEQSFTSHPKQSMLSDRDTQHMRQQLFPKRRLVGLGADLSVAVIEKDSDEKAEEGECDEEEADDKMDVMSMDDEAGAAEAGDEEAEDDAAIEGSIVGTCRYIHV